MEAVGKIQRRRFKKLETPPFCFPFPQKGRAGFCGGGKVLLLSERMQPLSRNNSVNSAMIFIIFFIGVIYRCIRYYWAGLPRFTIFSVCRADDTTEEIFQMAMFLCHVAVGTASIMLAKGSRAFIAKPFITEQLSGKVRVIWENETKAFSWQDPTVFLFEPYQSAQE